MSLRKNPHAVALGRKGGSVTSHKKAGASRENGKLGGRPKKVKPAEEKPKKPTRDEGLEVD